LFHSHRLPRFLGRLRIKNPATVEGRDGVSLGENTARRSGTNMPSISSNKNGSSADFSPVVVVVPSTIVARSTVIGIGRTIYPSISVTVVRGSISAVIGRGISAIICWAVTAAVVPVSWPVSVSIGSEAAD